MKKNLLFISLLVVSTSVMYAQNTSQKTIEKTVNSSKKKLDLHLLESQLSSNLSKKSQNLSFMYCMYLQIHIIHV